MKIKINLEKRGHNSKPGKEAGIISDQIRQEGAQVELTPQELAEKIKRGYTFTPGVIGGDIDAWKPRNAEGKRIALANPNTGARFCVSDFWQQQQIIAADIDNETEHAANKYELTPAAALAACKAAGIDPYLIYKTFSYKPEHEKFRVLIILDAPITDFEKAHDLIGRFANLFNRAIAAEYQAAGIPAEACADSTIEPVKLIFGGRNDSIFYQTESITPASIIEGLPQGATDAPGNAGNEKRQNNPPKYQNAAEAQNERDLLISALFAIDPARLKYIEWLKVAAAAKYAGLDYDTFDNWSAQDTGTNEKGQARYNEQANYKTWQSLANAGQSRGTKTATTGTIYYYAQQSGWNFPEKAKSNYDAEMQKAIEQEIENWAAQAQSGAELPADFFADSEEKTAAAEPEQMQAPAEAYAPENMTEPGGIQGAGNAKPEKKALQFESAADYLGGQYDADIEELKQYAGRKIGLHEDIDRHLTLFPGLAALGGQASLGKTTFAVNIVSKLLERGEHVLYFALEQRPEEIITKSLSRFIYEENPQTTIDNLQLARGVKTAEIAEARAMLAEKLENYHVIECDFETTAADIESTVNLYMKQRPNIKPVVIVDYLQLIAPPADFRGDMRGRVDENLKALKKMQKTNGLFVLVISSFNRSSNLEPISYESFKETSMIEFTCDYVFGLQLQIQDADNEDFYITTGPKGGKQQRPEFEKKALIHEEQTKSPKKVQFVAIKNRRGKQYFTASFDYYPAHDYFVPTKYTARSSNGEQNYAGTIYGAIKASKKRQSLNDAFNALDDDE